MGLKIYDPLNLGFPKDQKATTALRTNWSNGNAYIVMSGINTPAKSTKNTMEKLTQETSQPSMLPKSQTMIYSVLASLVKALASLEKGKDLRTLEGHSFLTSLGLQSTKDPDIYSLKMLKVSLVTTKEKLSPQYLGFSPTWGMELNGRYLTASTMEFPRTGRECSLSDILEKKVDDKYFLSEKMHKFLLNDRGKFPPQLRSDTTNKDSQTLISLLKKQNHYAGSELKREKHIDEKHKRKVEI